MTAVISMSRTYVDISKWWLKEDDGSDVSVNSVWEQIKGTENEVSRYTLTRAKNGGLEKIELSNLKKLVRLCSIWANKPLNTDDLIIEEKER